MPYLDHKIKKIIKYLHHPRHCLMVSALSITSETLTNVPEAVTLNTQLETQFKLSTRKEAVRRNSRGGTITAFKSKVGDDFGTNKAKALKRARQSRTSSTIFLDDSHFKKSKEASQSQHVSFAEEKFEELSR